MARDEVNWRITADAVAAYGDLTEGDASPEELVPELLGLAEQAHQTTEQHPRADGLEVWRTPKPQRLRLLVRRLSDALEIASVEPAFRGGPVYRSRHGRGGGPFGEQLRRERERRGWSLETLAALAGVSSADVALVERGGDDEAFRRALGPVLAALRVRLLVTR